MKKAQVIILTVIILLSVSKYIRHTLAVIANDNHTLYSEVEPKREVCSSWCRSKFVLSMPFVLSSSAMPCRCTAAGACAVPLTQLVPSGSSSSSSTSTSSLSLMWSCCWTSPRHVDCLCRMNDAMSDREKTR